MKKTLDAMLQDAMSLRSTINTKQDGQRPLPKMPRGHEIAVTTLIGQTVTLTDVCPFRGQAKITGVRKNSMGYVQYDALIQMGSKQPIVQVLFQRDIANFEYFQQCYVAGKALFAEFGRDLKWQARTPSRRKSR